MMDQAGEQKAVSSPGMYVLLYILLIPTAIYITNTQTTKQCEVGVHACRRQKEGGRKSEKERENIFYKTHTIGCESHMTVNGL